MIVALDVFYTPTRTVAASVAFADWPDEHPAAERRLELGPAADYEPGHFYRRELPPLLRLLAGQPATVLVVDGHVFLGPERLPGLGWHVWEATGLPVIGVAKSRFAGSPPEDEVRRGTSQRPLYVTAQGLDPAEARECIRRMHGAHRLPTLLKRVDGLTRCR